MTGGLRESRLRGDPQLAAYHLGLATGDGQLNPRFRWLVTRNEQRVTGNRSRVISDKCPVTGLALPLDTARAVPHNDNRATRVLFIHHEPGSSTQNNLRMKFRTSPPVIHKGIVVTPGYMAALPKRRAALPKLWRKAPQNKRTKGGHSLEQPVLSSETTDPCEICGTPVERGRIHHHMVRFHGARKAGRN